jgi:transcriptional regulator with XRE-family HTH domain
MSAMNKPATMTFGQIIRQRRIELGLTQEALAERVGDNVRQADISRLERDYIALPRRGRLEALAHALDVSPGYLLMQSGWLHSEDASEERADGERGITPEPVIVQSVIEAELPVTSYAREMWYDETAGVTSALHEAIIRARELSNLTRHALTESSNTVRRAGQTRRRRT